MNKYSGREGFLLIEMLVALSVIAVMTALMSRFMGQLGAITRLESAITAQSELEAGVSYLKRTIEAARPLRLLDAEVDTSPYMDGAGSSIKIATVTRQGLYSLGLRDAHIYLAPGADGNTIVHTLAPRRLVNGKPVKSADAVPILDSVTSLSFEYGAGGKWTDDWKKDGELPTSVRITITRTSESRTEVASGIARIAKRK